MPLSHCTYVVVGALSEAEGLKRAEGKNQAGEAGESRGEGHFEVASPEEELGADLLNCGLCSLYSRELRSPHLLTTLPSKHAEARFSPTALRHLTILGSSNGGSQA